MYEKCHEKPLSRQAFILRLLGMAATVAPLVGASLLVGVLGYRFFEGIGWVDALLSASMIMSGMGPVGELHSVGGKIFASIYALYSGLILIAVTGYLLSPFFHRVLHKFHRDMKKD